jgi:hypothetical protein
MQKATAQTDTIFRIQSLKVTLLPEADVLYKNVPNKFVVSGLKGHSIDSIHFSNGKAFKKDSVISITPLQAANGTLKLFVREKNGKSKMIFTREYKLLDFQEPKLNLDGVENDSAQYRMRMAVMGHLHLPKKIGAKYKAEPGYPIISFEAALSGGRHNDTIKIQGDRLSLPLRNKIDELDGGDLIQLKNIRYLYTQEDTLTLKQPFKVHIVNSSTRKIGF